MSLGRGRAPLVALATGFALLAAGAGWCAQPQPSTPPPAAPEAGKSPKTPVVVAPKIELYGTSWCGYCKKARKFFESRGLPFTDYDIEKDREAYQRFRKMNPQGGVPVVVIGKYFIPGYSEEKFEQAIRLAREER